MTDTLPLTNRRWWIAVAVMLVTVMEMIDLTIVNVALPQMMGSLSANVEQISWVLTAYIVSAAIVMPMSGFLINRLGAKRLILINIIGFLISSMLCGMATSLSMMVAFRILQGVFGATLVPLSQFILRYTFPQEEISKAMAIWGVGIMTGPIMGPTLGGYITDYLSWHWLFYINVPVCIIAFIMCWHLIEETPRHRKHIDWIGMSILAITVGALQIFLDRGNTVDWFSAISIRWLLGTFIFGIILFIWRGLLIEHNIINLRLFQKRNFTLGCAMIALFCASALGTITLQPILMQTLMGYPTQFSGLVMAPRGIASALAMGLTPQLIKRIDIRLVIGIGIILCIVSSIWLMNVNLDVSPGFFIWMGVVQGLGMGLFFVSISIVTFLGLSQQEYAEGSGLFSFWRSLGTSIGISLLNTLLSRLSQTNWNVLNGHLQPFNPNLHHWLAQQHTTLQNPQTLAQLMQQVDMQSTIMGFIACFHVVLIGYVLLLPLLFFMRKS